MNRLAFPKAGQRILVSVEEPRGQAHRGQAQQAAGGPGTIGATFDLARCGASPEGCGLDRCSPANQQQARLLSAAPKDHQAWGVSSGAARLRSQDCALIAGLGQAGVIPRLLRIGLAGHRAMLDCLKMRDAGPCVGAGGS